MWFLLSVCAVCSRFSTTFTAALVLASETLKNSPLYFPSYSIALFSGKDVRTCVHDHLFITRPPDVVLSLSCIRGPFVYGTVAFIISTDLLCIPSFSCHWSKALLKMRITAPMRVLQKAVTHHTFVSVRFPFTGTARIFNRGNILPVWSILVPVLMNAFSARYFMPYYFWKLLSRHRPVSWVWENTPAAFERGTAYEL